MRARSTTRLTHRSHGYAVSRKLRIRSEHTFAEVKNEHGLGRTRHRGLERVDHKSLLVATVQNLKRLARTLWRRAQSGGADVGYFGSLMHVIMLITVAECAGRRRRPSDGLFSASALSSDRALTDWSRSPSLQQPYNRCPGRLLVAAAKTWQVFTTTVW